MQNQQKIQIADPGVGETRQQQRSFHEQPTLGLGFYSIRPEAGCERPSHRAEAKSTNPIDKSQQENLRAWARAYWTAVFDRMERGVKS